LFGVVLIATVWSHNKRRTSSQLSSSQDSDDAHRSDSPALSASTDSIGDMKHPKRTRSKSSVRSDGFHGATLNNANSSLDARNRTSTTEQDSELDMAEHFVKERRMTLLKKLGERSLMAE
jgi:hypothetical protein